MIGPNAMAKLCTVQYESKIQTHQQKQNHRCYAACFTTNIHVVQSRAQRTRDTPSNPSTVSLCNSPPQTHPNYPFSTPNLT